MLFHSQAFILGFLPVVLILYYRLAHTARLRQYFLIAASLTFYGWWDVRFLPLITSQILVSWLLAELHFRLGRRWPLILAIVANLAVLGLFKYLDFFVSIAEDLSGWALPKSNIILPIGISFYTFQIVSYLVDALRNDAPRYNLRPFSLFVLLFPQLIAGPIVRHNELVGQLGFDPLRPGWAERLSHGLALFTVAAAAKVLIADKIAAYADPIYLAAESDVPSLSDALFVTFGFSLQIFFDFAAYSEMAIGLALALGLQLPRNFNQPYRATSLQDFWRRWHMTLSRFFRDYLYIPLGGSRNGPARYVFAALATMALCGLWHGAGWTFIIWGAAHGVGLVVGRAWTKLGLRLPAALAWLATLSFVVLLFVIFRAPDMATALHVFQGLTGAGGLGAGWDKDVVPVMGIAAVLALLPWTFQQAIDRWLVPDRRLAFAFAVCAVVVVLEVGKGQPADFIYFLF